MIVYNKKSPIIIHILYHHTFITYTSLLYVFNHAFVTMCNINQTIGYQMIRDIIGFTICMSFLAWLAYAKHCET